MIEEVLVGTDPEVFVVDKATNKVVSAIGFIPGEKEEPFPISDKGHAVQTDNVMAEFCVPASQSAEELHLNIDFCLKTINAILPDTMETSIIASAILEDKYLDNEKAQTFGCDPDYNAYSLEQNVSPDNKSNLRTAGGHIHIGYRDPKFITNINIIKAMDLFLGLPSLVLDTDKRRREMYGKAGAFRIKAYGVEYRTLSNFWIKTEESVRWMYRQVYDAIKFVNDENKLTDLEEIEVQLSINNNDLVLACKLMKKYNILTRFNVESQLI